MKNNYKDSLNCKSHLKASGHEYTYFDLNVAANALGFDIEMLPNSLKILFENLLRFEDGINVKSQDLQAMKDWLGEKRSDREIAFSPARVLMQDFTGVPAIVDMAAMRDAMKYLNGDVKKVNPLIDVDLVIDHSVQVDEYASSQALTKNVDLEMNRNKERYEFLKWGQSQFANFRVVPPGTGICHQVNLEYLAKVVCNKVEGGNNYIYPDTLVGTDSHTTMINALSVLGWGVGGIEAEAAMLGQSISMLIPEVVGFKLTGRIKEGITATDVVLTITNILRKIGVVGKFVEFYGSGLDSLSLADRATIANMAPEYGATCGLFPIDNETLRYLRLTNRDEKLIELVELYAKAQKLWRNDEAKIQFSSLLELDLSTLEASVAGPKRPQDRINLKDVPSNFATNLPSMNTNIENTGKHYQAKDFELKNGDVVIAAITSCTNTSNAYVMIGAGLVAKKAVERGLNVKEWVKTSLAPGSKIVSEYLIQSGLQHYLDIMGFNLVGYGCTTCIGNSGPLDLDIEKVIKDNNLVVASVLSGNRNFEGRVHQLVRANYLASPLLVVAYAIAGSININLSTDILGYDKSGKAVYLNDIWPTRDEINEVISKFVTPEMFKIKYADVFDGDKSWQNLKVVKGLNYNWDEKSTYIKNPPYFEDIDNQSAITDIKDARILALFGDSITTDHISPAGSIAKISPAAMYLQANGIDPKDFNSYGARRGNHEVMMRGTFANIRIKNAICGDGIEGGYTKFNGIGENISIYDAAMRYRNDHTPLVIFASREYGTGSSRDWAAKGTNLLGVKAVIAESFERIHRSNLVGMSVIPLTFKDSMSWQSLKLTGVETVSLIGLDDITPLKDIECIISMRNSILYRFKLTCRVDTEMEVVYIKSGGILHYVLKKLANEA